MGRPIRDRVAEGREKVGFAGRPATKTSRKSGKSQGIADHVFSIE